jgi:sugar lactone lactonase YvrE
VKDNYADSAVQNVLFDLLKVAMPDFDPPQGPAKTVTIDCMTPNAIIHFTLDGSDPDTNSPIYSSPLVINALTTVTARGFRSDLDRSDPRSVTYGLLIMENTVVTTFAGSTTGGLSNTVRTLALFAAPQDVCFDQGQNLYVADWANNVIRKIAPSGMVSTFAGSGINGYQDGNITNAQFSGPSGVCADLDGNFYVAETYCFNWRVRKIDTNGMVTTLVPTSAFCDRYRTLEVGPDRNLYVGHSGSVQEVFPNGTNVIIAGGVAGWTASVGIGIDAATNIYAATEARVWKIAPGQAAVTFAGSAAAMGGFSDGPRLQALFGGPLDATVDSAGNIFVSDRFSIRRIRPDGIVTTMAGKTASGFLNGRGSDALFGFTSGICSDTNGSVYVSDASNNCIRKISYDTAAIGIADDWQIAHFGYVGIDPNADPDLDGMSNFAEFWAGTDPLESNSSLAIDRTSLVSSGQIQIRWQTVAGKSYFVQYSTNLTTWNDLGNVVQGDGSMASVIDATPISNRRFYRVRLSGF